jgi:hypothetical protein
MKGFSSVLAAAAAATLIVAQSAWAQKGKEVFTAAYLRAAVGSFDEQAPVMVRAQYDAQNGLQNTRGYYLRNKGYSRFYIKDPDTNLAFGHMYCKQDSPVFQELLATQGRKVFQFDGYKGKGEDKEDAVYVTKVTLLEDLDKKAGAGPSAVSIPLRVTLKDNNTGKETVLVNVIKGQSYDVSGFTITVEDDMAGQR